MGRRIHPHRGRQHPDGEAEQGRSNVADVDDVPAVLLAERLMKDRASLYLGRNDSGVRFGSCEDNSLTIGPTRCGKTAGIISPSVAIHPGPVVLTSTRSDVVTATVAARTAIAEHFGGAVTEIGLGGYCSGTAPTSTWSVTDGCGQWNTALDRAFALATTAMPSEAERVWRDFASDLLSGCLFGAALGGDDDRTMSRFIKSADVSRYSQIVLDHCPDDHDAP